jgi:hypothetical protein
MEVSIWWLVIAGVLGTWTGFALCAVMTIGRDAAPEEARERDLVNGKAAAEVTIQSLR